MEFDKVNVSVVLVALIGAISGGELIDFGQDYSKDIQEAEQERQMIREEMQYLWDESDWNYNDIYQLYSMLCQDGYEKACDYFTDGYE